MYRLSSHKLKIFYKFREKKLHYYFFFKMLAAAARMKPRHLQLTRNAHEGVSRDLDTWRITSNRSSTWLHACIVKSSFVWTMG